MVTLPARAGACWLLYNELFILAQAQQRTLQHTASKPPRGIQGARTKIGQLTGEVSPPDLLDSLGLRQRLTVILGSLLEPHVMERVKPVVRDVLLEEGGGLQELVHNTQTYTHLSAPAVAPHHRGMFATIAEFPPQCYMRS